MQPFIHLIADYGVGDGAFSEVIQKLRLLIPDCQVVPTSVPKFSTLATGFWTYQLSTVNPVPSMVIYTNTAPRKDRKTGRQENEGERLLYAKLNNGAEIVGVNAGFCFSFVKPVIAEFREISVANKGSQFRSRDFYPDAVADVALGTRKLLGDPLDLSVIPDPPDDRIAWIDGYGNLKTSMRASSVHFKAGQPVLISLNGVIRTAYYTAGTFSVHEGELAFAPGSSGGEDRFMEIFLRGLSAYYEFGKPDPEAQFTVSKQ
jgi:S-adenosylmethionine hydrolase